MIAKLLTRICFTILLALGPLATAPVAAADGGSHSGSIVVVVREVGSSSGVVDCGLFGSEEGFPMAADDRSRRRAGAVEGTVELRFDGLAPGTYAVAVSHDENGNGRTDTNLFGIPREAWGVSNDVRPTLRPPRFEEAAFELGDGEILTVEIQVR